MEINKINFKKISFLKNVSLEISNTVNFNYLNFN